MKNPPEILVNAGHLRRIAYYNGLQVESGVDRLQVTVDGLTFYAPLSELAVAS